MAQQYNLLAFRGLAGNVYSTGLDAIAAKAKAMPGIDPRGVKVVSYTEWRQEAERVKNWRDPFIIMGHSYGVAAMFGFARQHGKSVPLAISIDPSQWAWLSFSLWGSGGNVKPANVKRCVNFFQSSGLIGRQLIDGAVNNSVVDSNHRNIDDNPLVQATALAEIKSIIS